MTQLPLRLTATIIGGYSGSLLTPSFEPVQRPWLAVRVSAITLANDAVFEISATPAYLAFQPTAAPLGLLWRTGDQLQITSTLEMWRELPTVAALTAIRRIVDSARLTTGRAAANWLTWVQEPARRRTIADLVTDYQAGRLSFAVFQERVAALARPLPSKIRLQLAHVQQAQIALMRQVYAELDALAPEHLVIAAPTQLRLLQAAPPDERPAYPVDSARLADPAYQAALLATITPAADTDPGLPLDPPSTAPSPLTPYRIRLRTTVAQTRPRSQRQRLEVTVDRATTALVLDDRDHPHAQDGLLATVAAATAVEKFNAQEESFSGDLHLQPHVPVLLVFDAALIRLQLSLGWQGSLTGRLRLVRVIAAKRVSDLRHARAAAVAKITALTRRQAKQVAAATARLKSAQQAATSTAGQAARSATGQAITSIAGQAAASATDQAATSTAGQAAVRAAAGRAVAFQAPLTELAKQLQTGRLPFAAYQTQVATLLGENTKLANARQAAWNRYVSSREALTRPVYLLSGVSAHQFTAGGAMMRQLTIEPAGLSRASYRHQLFAQWQANAQHAVW
ncbi:hypothetical protein [Lacticaseibacillus parakribbianus]|uniref:hypothetical protein n=1 Tax=Lacticaseibacillus parakribbianus TaxID=2970927 RepID=UPI0021CB4B26|nr:hypothetical protein [Lacticaseibacillus parakribbianus]